MPTQCTAEQLSFSCVEGPQVVAEFDGGRLTSDAGALLLGQFVDRRSPLLIEHSVRTLIGQRVFGLALGYEDLNDHDELRSDPLFGVLAGKLTAKRRDCQAVAGKSTLNRLELFPSVGGRRITRLRLTPRRSSACS